MTRLRAVAAALALTCGLTACSVSIDRGDGEAAPSPAAPVPSAPAPSAAATPEPSASRPPAADPDGTAFGASFQRVPGEQYPAALERTEAALDLQVVRVFYPGAPDPWPGKAPGRDQVVSFKLDPLDVLAGRHDAEMTTWFEEAPTDQVIHWVYWHEPEGDSERGMFEPEDYRQAYAHLAALADATGRDDLHATVVLMSWSLNPNSGRDWQDWFPPADSVDVLAWDVYNRGRGERFYADPAELLGPLREASESVGKPWGIGEMASPTAPGDEGGEERARWITSVGCYLVANDARFAAWFDFLWQREDGEQDYRLDDEPSATAWRDLGTLQPDDPACSA